MAPHAGYGVAMSEDDVEEHEDHDDRHSLNGWYELFSRGARDWLRHSDKVRDAVREHLPQIVAGADSIHHGARTVRVPGACSSTIDFDYAPMSNPKASARARSNPAAYWGLPTARVVRDRKAPAAPRGRYRADARIQIDDIIDWLWEDLQLPNLQTRVGPSRSRTGNAKAGIDVVLAHAWIGVARSRRPSSVAGAMHRCQVHR